MEVLRMLHEGYAKADIAAHLDCGVATVYRDAKWIDREKKAGRLQADSYIGYTPRGAAAVPAALVHVQGEPTLEAPGAPRVVLNDAAGPQGPAQRAGAMEHAARLWRKHTPDPLVALVAFGVDSTLLADWLRKGRKCIATGQTDDWEALVYMQRAAAYTDSLMGYQAEDGYQTGIMERAFNLLNDGDPKVAMQAIRLLMEQGAMRNYYGKSIDLNVSAALPTAPEAVDSIEGSGLDEALGLIGAEGAPAGA